MGSSTTTETRADPWEPAQPYILEGLDSAQQLWNQTPNGFVINPWDGPAVAAEDPALRDANAGILANTRAQRGQIANAQSLAAGVGNSAGTGHTPLAFRQGQASGMAASQNPTFQNVMATAANRQEDPRFAQGVSAGLGTRNAEGFDRTVNNLTRDDYGDDLRASLRRNVEEAVMPGMNATFAGSGMTGSSLHQANLAKALSSGMAGTEAALLNRAQDRQVTAAQMGQGALENTRNRMMQAGTIAENASASRMGQRAQAAQASQSADMAIRDMHMRAGQGSLDATMGNRDQALRAAGMAPGLSAASYNPLMQHQQVGQTRTDRSQTQLAADIMADQQMQAAPIDAISNYLALTSGLGGQFGSSMSTQQSNPGLFGMLGAGAQGVGLLGLLSDRRAKENIRRVGQMDNGLSVYVYTYKGDNVTHMGVMAQEAQKVVPGAVSKRPDGLLQVDYSKLGDAA